VEAAVHGDAQFAGYDEGGRTWGRIVSLIETAKFEGVEPFAYLKATLEAIARAASTTSSHGISCRQPEVPCLSDTAYVGRSS
jgi:hypothetical protein